jgi:predicted dehydrogenase
MIGCGGIAQVHMNSYKQIKQKEPAKFEFAAMCDPVSASAKQFADQAAALQDRKPKVYTSVPEMLAEERLDAVDICTPHSEHHIAGIACLDAGVNVMIEKPLGLTVKASKALIASGKKNKKIVATAENIRRGVSQRTAHWIINDLKILGAPRLLFSQSAGWYDPSTEKRWHWRVDKWMGGGGMVMDSGAHFCDTIRYLYGDPDTVYAKVQQLEKWPHKKGDETVLDSREDTWATTITFKNGLVAVWSWTMAAPGYSYTNVVHYGSKGCILDHGDAFHGPFSSAEIIVQEGPKRVTTPMVEMQKQYLAQLGEAKKNALFPYGFTDGYVLECYDFLDAVEKKRKPEVDGETGLKAKAICESIFESATIGEAVKYDDVLNGKIDEYQKPINEHWGL